MSTLKIKRENGKIFCPLADSWHIETPEEKVRQEYIKILVENYGYSLDQMAQEIKVNNSQRGQGKARADIVIWKSKQDKIESKAAFIVVECKAENVRIREEDYYQGYNYASWAGASFFVTTNEKETKYFNVDKDYLPKELVEVVVKAKLFCPEIAGLFCRIAGLFCHDSRANLSLKPVCFGIAIS